MSAAQNPWPHIGQLFVEEGYLTSAQLEGALAEQRRSGERLGEILIERGYITRIHLAGALSKQWSWKGEIPSSIEPPAAPVQLVEESVEPEPAAAAPEFVLVPELPATDSPHTYPSANGVPMGAPTSSVLEGDAESQPLPTPSVEEIVAPTPSPVRIEAFAAPVSGLEDQERPLRDPDFNGGAEPQASPTPSVKESGELAASSLRIDALAERVSGLEDQERLLRELQARLRDTHEQLAAGEARVGSLDAIVAELSKAYAALNARLDAQTREIDDLRRVVADQSTRLASAARSLLA
jgi:uncharacterized coiled-coil protein SlyX